MLAVLRLSCTTRRGEVASIVLQKLWFQPTPFIANIRHQMRSGYLCVDEQNVSYPPQEREDLSAAGQRFME